MNNFDGLDIVTERHVDESTIRRAISNTLSLPEERIAIIDDAAHCPPKDSFDAVCIRTPVHGQFAEILAIQCEKRDTTQPSEFEIFTQLAYILGVRCLMADEGPNPYMMWASDSGAPPTRVSLEPTSLDEDHYDIKK